MIGLAVDSFEFFESLPDNGLSGDIALQLDAELFQYRNTCLKLKKMRFAALYVKNPVSARLNRLILDSPFKLRMDSLESFESQIKMLNDVGAEKVMLDFDLPALFENAADFAIAEQILGALKGITYSAGMELELLFRLPFSGMEDFAAAAAFFRQNSMLRLNYSADIHIHEAGFDRELLKEVLLPVEFDVKTVNFLYDAALGNKINAQNLKKMINYMKNTGAEHDFFLCPSGNVNYQNIQTDLQQWFNITKQEE